MASDPNWRGRCEECGKKLGGTPRRWCAEHAYPAYVAGLEAENVVMRGLLAMVSADSVPVVCPISHRVEHLITKDEMVQIRAFLVPAPEGPAGE